MKKIEMYIDYTIVNIKIKNNTSDKICLDSRESIDKTYLYDENNVTYTSFLNELTEQELEVGAGEEKNIKIKFNKRYNPKSRTLRGIEFKDVILNYDNYKNGLEPKNKITIDIEI